MGPIQLVVVDLAGTIIDDRGMVLHCALATAHAYDLPGTPGELNALMGLNKREVFGRLAARRYPLEPAKAGRLADEALANFVASMRTLYAHNLAPIPGAGETFAFLHTRSILAATGTGCDATIGGMIMERLNWPGRLIDLAVFSSDVPRGRPAPYMIFHAMERLGILDVHQAMKVGDSPADLAEGFNAGCGEIIGVLSGSHTAATLATCHHTRLIESVAHERGACT